jgi:hypothetical protein
MSTTTTVHKLQRSANYLSHFRLQLLHQPLTMCQQKTPWNRTYPRYQTYPSVYHSNQLKVSDVCIYNTHVQDSQPNVNIVDTDHIDVTPMHAVVPE